MANATSAVTVAPSITAEAETSPDVADVSARRVVNATDVVLPDATVTACFLPYGVVIDTVAGTSASLVTCTAITALPAMHRPVAVAVIGSSGADCPRTIEIVYVELVV